MGLLIEKVCPHHLPELYHMMVMQGFPDVPDTFEDAREQMDKALIFGAFAKNRLKAGFIFGDIGENSAFFDVVCAPTFHGKWATPKVLRELYRIAFHVLGLDYVWVQPKNKKALKATLAAGFIYATPPDVEEPVLVLTCRTVRYPKLLLKNYH